MASIEIRFVVPGTRSYTVGSDVVGGVMKMEAIGAGGGGGTGTVGGGGGGKGGSFARRNAQSVQSGDVLSIAVPSATGIGGIGAVATVSRNSTVLLSARGGTAGANGGALNGGAGATAPNGTFVGDVEFLGGNGSAGGVGTRGAGGGGAGTTGAGGNAAGTTVGLGTEEFGGNGGSPLTGQPVQGQNYGGGGVGATTITAGSGGAQGIVVLTYSTGVGTITHTAQFNRLATLSRLGLASITHTAVFNRLVTVRRAFTNSITHVSRTLKTIKLPRIASLAHTARQTVKKVRLTRIASIVHTARLRRAIEFLRTANIVHTARFQRLVTLRRRFTATIQHRARQLMKLEGRLIPREGGGGVVQTFRNLFLFDD